MNKKYKQLYLGILTIISGSRNIKNREEILLKKIQKYLNKHIKEKKNV
jgi:hypothetical protein